MPFLELRKDLAELILKEISAPGVTASDIEKEFSTPPNIQLGHIAWPCFRLAKTMGVAPGKLSQEIASKISSGVVTATATGPYVNFRWQSNALYQKTLSKIFKEKEKYGHDESGRGKTVLLEYCSPNIAKPLFFHHIRSTLIGSTLANIYRATGYKTERINFVGDWGAQFARLVAAFEMWGDKNLLNQGDISKAMAHLLEIYVKFHKELETHPEYADKANQCLKKLESKHPETTELWKKVREISLKAMDLTLARLNVSFDHVEGESEYVEGSDKILEEVKKKADAKLSDGAWIVELPGIATPALIQKRDGTTLYLTRDIAAAMDRLKRYNFDKAFYVVSEQQRLHFQQLFATIKKMGQKTGMDWSERCEHLSFGTVLFNSERMSTREGRAIYLDDVLNESEKLALKECTEKNPGLKDKETVARMVGIGAVIFGQLSANKQRDINFDWAQVLAFDGETGPYVQYSHVRCQSLLEKALEKNEPIGTLSDTSQYTFAGEEDQLVLTLSQFRSVLHQAVNDNEPCHLTRYLIDVAKAYNRFYYQLPVLQATDPLQKQVRLNLVAATQTVLKNGLTLLGISCPQEM